MASTTAFDHAATLGTAGPVDLAPGDRHRSVAAPRLTYPRSAKPRGLALRSLRVTENWDGVWGWLRDNRQQIYFTTVAVDLSGQPPTIHPPEEVPADAVHDVEVGDEIEFTFGRGAPLFGPRTVVGGLAVFVMVCESDGGVREIGTTLAQVHEDLSSDDGSFMTTIMKFVTDPAGTLADEVLDGLTAALQPVATILKSGKDDYIGTLKGIYPADSSWDGQLVQEWNGNRVELAEI